MRGLTLFLTDLRKCKGKEEEVKRINKELANIRSKFNGKKTLNGYQKKKYVSKLLLMFLLGQKIDFGYMEAVNLLSSNAYSEKQIGYLFISVVMGNNHNFFPMVISSIKNDLSSGNMVFQNLALQFVANNISKEVADSLVGKVLDMLLSSETVDSVKQTAALTLLQLLRFRTSGLYFDALKTNRIINLISHPNLGVVTAAASLIDFLAKTFSQFQPCVSQCIVRLSKIVNVAYVDFQDYSYYFNAAPWLTVKLLRILQNFTAPTDACLRSRLSESLGTILNKTQDPPKTKKIEHTNAKYAVVFEAISLIIHMELNASLLTRAIGILSSALYKKESNIRFMALDIMTQLSDNQICLANVKAQWKSVLNALRQGNDVTIKKRAIDLLYVICDAKNAKLIVDEMMCYLEAEIEISEDVVLKAAALAEHFCTESLWYVDTVFNMLKICGDVVDDSVWHTLVKVVIRNDMMREHAASVSYAVLHDIPCRDVVVKVAGYILGEFGYLIAKHPKCNHIKQFDILRKIYSKSSPSTRYLLLTTYMKFLNIYSDLKDEIQSIFRDKSNRQSENEEIQQRAVEYLKLSEIASRDLLAAVLEEMPFSSREESTVVATIEKRKSQVFEIGQIERNPGGQHLTKFRSELNLSLVPRSTESERAHHMIRSASHSNLQHRGVYNNASCNYNLHKDVYSDASRNYNLHKDVSSDASRNYNLHKDVRSDASRNYNLHKDVYNDASRNYNLHKDVYNASSNYSLLMDLFKDTSTSEAVSENPPPVPTRMETLDYPTTINEFFLRNLLYNQAGVLFENSTIKVFVECEFRERLGKFHLKFVNKLTSPLSDFVVKGNFTGVENRCSMWIKPGSSMLQAEDSSTVQDIHLECLQCFSARPSITLNFTCEAEKNEFKIALPLTVNKFIGPISMDQESYCRKWQSLRLPEQEDVKEFAAKCPMVDAAIREKLTGFGVYIVDSFNVADFNCAGVLYTIAGNVGFLLKLERFPASNKYRLSARSCHLELCEAITELLPQLL